jgi:hypothetical protein
MAIFPVIKLEDNIQVDEKVRIDATHSFIDKGNAAITLVRIEPFATAGYVTVSGTGLTNKDWYLDYSYATSGVKTITVEITAGTLVTKTKDITVVTAVEDYLFSSDNDLLTYEPEILNYLPKGWSSFNRIHRRAQQTILTYLDEKRMWTTSGARFVKTDLIDKQEVKDWAIALTINFIYEGLSNVVGDVFSNKATKYQSMADKRAIRAMVRIDADKNGTQGNLEGYDQFTGDLVRG